MKIKSKPKVQHTPTPWTIRNEHLILIPNGENVLNGTIQIESENSHIACVSSIDLSFRECIANAAFIVQAVNSHEELLKAAYQLASLLHNDESSTCTDKNLCDACKAIAKVEEKI